MLKIMMYFLFKLDKESNVMIAKAEKTQAW